MSFWTSIENAPKEAETWIPMIYVRDPVTGTETPYYPDEYLDIGQVWLCPLYAGDGLMVDYRCIVYDVNGYIFEERTRQNVIMVDGKRFVFDWKADGAINWVIAIPIGIAATLGIIAASKRRR